MSSQARGEFAVIAGVLRIAARCALVLVCSSVPRAAAGAAAAPDFQALARQASDSTQAKQAATALRAYLAGQPDSSTLPFARVMLVQALLTLRAPAAELLAAIDQAERVLPEHAETRVSFYASLGRALAQRGIAYDRALRYTSRAVALCPKTPDSRRLMSLALAALGEVQLRMGKPAEAAATLARAVADSPDSQTVLAQLGVAYEKAGKDDLALNAYLRSAASFAGNDTSAYAPLRALWKKQHGTLEGLAARLTSMQAAALNQVALEGHAVASKQRAPNWRLPDLDEKIHDLASYKGRVVVMDFWGSWCGPCRLELPLIEAMYQRYKDNPAVAFVGINWERAQGAEEHRSLAREFVKKNRLSFPIMYDHERNAVGSYQIQGFPTVFLVDREGMLRYVNLGFDPHVDQILEAQIQSLLN